MIQAPRGWFLQHIVLTAIISLFSLTLCAETTAEPPALPAGLTSTQLRGSLVCPPLWFPGRGVLVATDDRNLQLIRPDGTLVWQHTVDRFIRGPLYSMGNALVLLSLSGDQVLAIRLDGTLVWQRYIPGSGETWFLGTPEARLVQLFHNGNVIFYNPDGSEIFRLNLSSPISDPPRPGAAGFFLNLAGGKSVLLHGNGSVETLANRQVITPLGDQDSISFHTESVTGSYIVQAKAGNRELSFTSKGIIGHWLVDNRQGGLVTWGDSLWRCWMWQPPHVSATQSPPVETKPIREPLFAKLDTKANFERKYLMDIIIDNPMDGTAKVLEHIQAVASSKKLAGRLDLYEDMLIWILDQKSRGATIDPTIPARVLAVYAHFPSLRRLEPILALLSTSDDYSTVLPVLDFCTALGTDPDANILDALLTICPRWLASGKLAVYQPALAKLYERCHQSWPADARIAQFRVWLSLRN